MYTTQKSIENKVSWLIIFNQINKMTIKERSNLINVIHFNIILKIYNFSCKLNCSNNIY